MQDNAHPVSELSRYHLVSHVLCPYVQRAVIVLAEKGVAFRRSDVDLSNKPDWFLQLSPLRKTPVLVVDGEPLFESAVICDYLDETVPPRLHPADPLQRARHRAWVEFASATLNTIAALYNAADDAALSVQRQALEGRFATLEPVLAQSGSGPWFAGTDFSIVDAAFGPVFRYLDVFDALGFGGWMATLPRAQAWRAALQHRPSVAAAVSSHYPAQLEAFLRRRNSALSRKLSVAPAEALAA